ncbi:hypothetical protein BD779DRAFT_1680869 [Infundibulicybe gibba]|nr:hypothetical protein BD779DRAFT_1680869 [Infundibulicybe gibba]
MLTAGDSQVSKPHASSVGLQNTFFDEQDEADAVDALEKVVKKKAEKGKHNQRKMDYAAGIIPEGNGKRRDRASEFTSRSVMSKPKAVANHAVRAGKVPVPPQPEPVLDTPPPIPAESVRNAWNPCGVRWNLVESVWSPVESGKILVDSIWIPPDSAGLRMDSVWSLVDSVWTPYGFRVESGGFRMDSTLYGLHVDSVWIPYGFRVDSIWTPCGLHVDSVWIPCGLGVDSVDST